MFVPRIGNTRMAGNRPCYCFFFSYPFACRAIVPGWQCHQCSTVRNVNCAEVTLCLMVV